MLSHINSLADDNEYYFEDLADIIGDVKGTHAHLDFDYYVFANKIGEVDGATKFEHIAHQHHFLLYKDKNGGTFAVSVYLTNILSAFF